MKRKTINKGRLLLLAILLVVAWLEVSKPSTDATADTTPVATGQADSAAGHSPQTTDTRYAEGLELPALRPETKERVLRKTGFTLSFNTRTNLANWVAWTLDSDKLIERESRTDHFNPDPELPDAQAVTTEDYTGSGWDRGHLCPAGDNKWHWKAMQESFYMTNICPQDHNLNRGDWKELEEACRRWAKEKGRLYIVCGPMLKQRASMGYIGKKHRIRVPEAFFKVVMYMDNGQPQAAGFVFPNKNGNAPLTSYMVSVDEVEQLTGLDFFPALPDDMEEAAESVADATRWQ